ncbi:MULTISPECIES: hypothetical protein [unclassified Mycobacterium]|uniref:hypothetical protein n=1 Tax=unclassified Mycobacterium TaxID=2642494 RepID=UPI0029C72A39|nr:MULTISPECIES: hypothetical protein [unclassified Mycobacterium]
MKKLVVLGAGAIAMASAALLHPAVALSDPAGASSVNVVGEPYAKALAILKSQGARGVFGGSFGSDVPQSACIVDKQKINSSGKMILMLNCTTKAVQDATASTPQAPTAATGAAPGAPAPGTPGQGTYGGPIGVPVPVG